MLHFPAHWPIDTETDPFSYQLFLHLHMCSRLYLPTGPSNPLLSSRPRFPSISPCQRSRHFSCSLLNPILADVLDERFSHFSPLIFYHLVDFSPPFPPLPHCPTYSPLIPFFCSLSWQVVLSFQPIHLGVRQLYYSRDTQTVRFVCLSYCALQ